MAHVDLDAGEQLPVPIALTVSMRSVLCCLDARIHTSDALLLVLRPVVWLGVATG